MFTLHASQITTAGIQANNPVSSVFVMVPENVCTICLKKFHTGYGKSITTAPLFSYWNSSKRVFYCFAWKTCHSCELLLELIIVVIQDSEDGKRSVCKECARKIVNCYRMFTELREAWRVVMHSTRRREVLHELLRQPVLGVEFLFKASDLATGVTPKEKRQKNSACENEAAGAQRRPEEADKYRTRYEHAIRRSNTL